MIVPPILTFLATDPRVDNYDLSSLRTITSGAAPVLHSMYEQCVERFAKKGIPINLGCAYGLTEIGMIRYFNKLINLG